MPFRGIIQDGKVCDPLASGQWRRKKLQAQACPGGVTL